MPGSDCLLFVNKGFVNQGRKPPEVLKSTLPTALLLLLMIGPNSGCLSAPDGIAGADPEIFVCGMTNCTLQMILCVLDPDCRATLECNSGCASTGNPGEEQACHLYCQLAQGNFSEIYSALVQCFAERGCLPSLPAGTDGQCLVTSENIHKVHILDSLEDIEGTWLEVRGLNCGVPGSNWEGGYDALPCRSDAWVFQADQWWYHTSFCAPAEDRACDEQGSVFLLAEPVLSTTQPGLLEVPYINPPLQPQDERWYILSRPHPDWIMYTYCGSTPIGEYAGLNVMTRSPNPSNDTMPNEVEAAFRLVAGEFGFDYDAMCIIDQSQCPPVTAQADVQSWVAGQ
jgi:hypothetical protein